MHVYGTYHMGFKGSLYVQRVWGNTDGSSPVVVRESAQLVYRDIRGPGGHVQFTVCKQSGISEDDQ